MHFIGKVICNNCSFLCFYESFRDSITFLTDFVKGLDVETRQKVLDKVIKNAEKSNSKLSTLFYWIMQNWLNKE